LIRLTEKQKERLSAIYDTYGTHPFTHDQALSALRKHIDPDISQQSENGFINSMFNKGLVVKTWSDGRVIPRDRPHYSRCHYKIKDEAERLCKLIALRD
jgi:hypothetical protein